MDIKKLLKGTEFEKVAPCVAAFLTQAGVTSVKQLPNLPGILRGNICHVDIYRLTEVLLEQVNKPIDESIVVEAVPAADEPDEVKPKSRRKK